jgi:hypothetical protein
MALFEDVVEGLTGSWVSSALIGVGVVLVAPLVASALAPGIRPLMKTVVKGGVLVYDKGAEVLAEAGEQLSDIIAEVRAERSATAATAASAAAEAPSNGHTTDL